MDPLLYSQVQRFSRKGAVKIVTATGSVSAASYRTDLNITGAGYLLFVATFDTASVAGKEQIRITIDGGTANLIGSKQRYLYSYHNTQSGTQGGKLFVFDIPFQSSVKVEVYNSDSSADTITSTIGYILAS